MIVNMEVSRETLVVNKLSLIYKNNNIHKLSKTTKKKSKEKTTQGIKTHLLSGIMMEKQRNKKEMRK